MILWKLKTPNGTKFVTDINKVKATDYSVAEKMNIEMVCAECGERYGKRRKNDLVTTIEVSKCDICGKVRGLCHIRHFNYLRK